MLNRLPTQTPPLWLMLDDIGRPTPEQLGRALGVTPRTIRRWIAEDAAPRLAILALFWLTRWGHSVIAADSHNAAVLAACQVRALTVEARDLRADLARLLAMVDTGAANAPTWRALPMARVLPFKRTAGT